MNLLDGGFGNDTFEGTYKNHSLHGPASNDVLFGGGGVNLLDGGIGNDVLYGVYGPILGRDGDDVIRASTDSDFVGGGSGDDTISVPWYDGGDEADYGAATSYSASGFDALATSGGALAYLTLVGIEVLRVDDASVSGTVEQFEQIDRILNYWSPAERIGIDLVSAGVLDNSDELNRDLDLDGDGILDDRAVNVLASDLGDTIITGSRDDHLEGGAGNDTFRDYSSDVMNPAGEGTNILDGGLSTTSSGSATSPGYA